MLFRSAPSPSGSARPAACTRWIKAASRNASLPGRIARCSPATRAVSVRRGSTTMQRPPRAFSAPQSLTSQANDSLGAAAFFHSSPAVTCEEQPSARGRIVRCLGGNPLLPFNNIQHIFFNDFNIIEILCNYFVTDHFPMSQIRKSLAINKHDDR